MQTFALILVATAGLWLVGVALLMAFLPEYSLALCNKMSARLEASSRRVQFIEQGLRVLAGVALVVRAPASKLPLAFEIFGWLLIVSSTIIMLLPIRWHGKYGALVFARLTPLALRLLSPVPAIVGTGLIWAAT